jgi:hypothetical protein
MTRGDDDDEERDRQQRERARLSFLERLYGIPFRITSSGFLDRRSLRRTGRIVQLPLRVHPRVKALVDAIMERDQVPSYVVLFEQFAQAYIEKEGDIDWSKIPSDETLLDQIERKRDEDDDDDNR